MPPGDTILAGIPKKLYRNRISLTKNDVPLAVLLPLRMGLRDYKGDAPGHGTSCWSLFWLQLSRVSFPQIPGSGIVR